MRSKDFRLVRLCFIYAPGDYIMIEFKVSLAEIEALAKTVPNLKIILDAMREHTEIKLVVDNAAPANILGEIR